MGELRHLPSRQSDSTAADVANEAAVYEFPMHRIQITSTPALSPESMNLHPNEPNHQNRPQRWLYNIGKRVLMIGTPDNHLVAQERSQEIARNPYKVRRIGLGIGAAVLTAGLSISGMTAAKVNTIINQTPEAAESTCTFSPDTTVVSRGLSETNRALAVIHTRGVDWNQGDVEADKWIDTHNTGLKDWPGEQVTIPVSYDCK